MKFNLLILLAAWFAHAEMIKFLFTPVYVNVGNNAAKFWDCLVSPPNPPNGDIFKDTAWPLNCDCAGVTLWEFDLDLAIATANGLISHHYEWHTPMTLALGHSCALLGPANELLGDIAETRLHCHGLFGAPVRRNLAEGHYDQCTEHHDERPGSTSEARCLAMKGCGYDASTDHCWDECTWGHDSRPGQTSHARCMNMAGCAYDRNTDHCWATSTFQHVPMTKCHDVQGWYDSDGPMYNCAWYTEVTHRCYMYGNGYSNFGHTANTACCACRNLSDRGRRALNADEVQLKRGFVPTGEVFVGIAREFAPAGDAILETPMFAPELTISESNCEKRDWWVGSENMELTCNDGEVIGALFKNGEDAYTTSVYSLEQGYCCQLDPSPSSCYWKSVHTHSIEDWMCEDGSYLNGFKVNENGNLLKNVIQIKCCGGARRSLRLVKY